MKQRKPPGHRTLAAFLAIRERLIDGIMTEALYSCFCGQQIRMPLLRSSWENAAGGFVSVIRVWIFFIAADAVKAFYETLLLSHNR